MNAVRDRQADLILKNGIFWTVDPALPRAEALAVQGDTILAVGSTAEIAALQGPNTRVIDLGGRLALPGFNDAHTHFVRAALQFFTSFDLINVTRLEDAQQMLRTYAGQRPTYKWLHGMRWSTTRLNGGAWPTKADLDAVVSDRPTAVVDTDGHAQWVNSAALKALNYTRDTPDPAGGRIMRDESGEPTGILLETAHYPIVRYEQISQPEFEQIFPLEVARLHRLGITSLSDNLALPLYRDALIPMARDGRLKLRVNYWPHYRDGFEQALELRERFQVRDILQVVGIKAFMDGVLGNYTAWMLEPYSDRPEASGFSIYTPEELLEMALTADAQGFQLVIHAIGDRSVRVILDVYEHLQRTQPRPDPRHRIEHVEVAHPIDQARFARLGVPACIMPVHCTSDLRAYLISRLGEGRANSAYPWRAMQDLGVHQPFGTDWSSTDMVAPNPLENIFATVTRQRPDEYGGEVWHPEQRLTLAQAIQGYTFEPAYAEFTEKRKGSLRPGKLADIIVLSKNIFEAGPAALLDAKVEMTVFGGEVVHRTW